MKLKFLGATREVTGSSYFLDEGDTKVLVDCGLFQERDLSSRNWKTFPVPPDKIDYVLLTHVHLDHSGLIPKLIREGFAGEILMTPASKELFPIVILDSARMQEEDAAFKKRRHEQENRHGPYPEVPLYTVEDAERSFSLLHDIAYEEHKQLSSQVEVCFHDAGHILGSAMIEVTFHNDIGSRTIVFSGDVGQWRNPLLNDPHVFDSADYVVMESTYGNRAHANPQGIDQKLAEIINNTVRTGGNLLIPTFVIERAQELLYYINLLTRTERIPSVPTFLDSPMAVEVMKAFERCARYFGEKTMELFRNGQSPFEFPSLKLTESVEESKTINQSKESSIIIAGSGMLNGGRIKHHLAREITRPESTLLFVGYQAAGTLGRQILDGASPVRIYGKTVSVQMKIEKIEGFSAHAGMDDLRRWLDNFKSPPRHVFLTHGEQDSMSSLENYIQSKNGWRVSAPEYLEEYYL